MNGASRTAWSITAAAMAKPALVPLGAADECLPRRLTISATSPGKGACLVREDLKRADGWSAGGPMTPGCAPPAPTVAEFADRGAIRPDPGPFRTGPRASAIRRWSLSLVTRPADGRCSVARSSFVDECCGLRQAEAAGRAVPRRRHRLAWRTPRFYPGEEANDPAFAAAGRPGSGDLYVNDALLGGTPRPCLDRGASPHLLPAYAGPVDAGPNWRRSKKALGNPEKPVAAVVGGGEGFDQARCAPASRRPRSTI